MNTYTFVLSDNFVNFDQCLARLTVSEYYIYPRDHSPPHFHAYYAEYEALIDIRTLEIMAGDLPGKQLKRIQKWAKLVQEELLNEFIRLQKP